MMRRLALAVSFLLLASVPAQAQQLGSMTVDVAEGGLVSPNGTGGIEVTVEVPCTLIVEAQGERAVTVTGESPGFDVQDDGFEISPEACVLGQGSVSQVANLTITPRADARGLTPHPINVTASLGTFSAPGSTNATIDYRPGHELETDITFPATVDGETLTFNVTIRFTGNARTMVMFADEQCTGCSVSGLRAITADPPASETFQVTFHAPDGDWDNRTFDFSHFSHWALPSGAGDPTNEQTESWQFVQGERPEQTEGGEDSPGAGLLGVLALLGLVVLARRR